MIKTLEQINREFMQEAISPDQNGVVNNSFIEVASIKAEQKPVFITEINRNDLAEKDSSVQIKNSNNFFKADRELSVPAFSSNIWDEENVSESMLKKNETGGRKGIFKKILSILLIILVGVLTIATEIFNSGANNRVYIFGYAAFTVLSDSMHSEIPIGSFILVKKTEPKNIGVGSDITFLRERDDAIVTHRVMHVYEHYGEENRIGFQTQGIDNLEPDHDIVVADNVIGVVHYTIPHLGTILDYISVNIGLFLVIFGGATVALILIREYRQPKKKRVEAT